MAVLDAVPGLEVVVCIDGKPIEEYADDEGEEVGLESVVAEYQAARTVRKYVESVSDKEFTIEIRVDKPFVMDVDSLMFPVEIDGKFMVEPLIPKKNMSSIHISGAKITSRFTRKVDGIYVAAPGQTDRQFVKKFRFANIETTADDSQLADVKNDMKHIDQLGEIIVKLYRGGESHATDGGPQRDTLAINRATKVHEKALKGQAKSHSTLFGPATELVRKSYALCERLDGEDYPHAIFKFKYRSREALQSLLIIKRTPSPDPEDAPVDSPALNLDNLNPAQKTQLEKFLQGLMNGGDSSRNSPNRTIKRERDENTSGGNTRKKRRSGSKVTIDLTEDSDEEDIAPLR